MEELYQKLRYIFDRQHSLHFLKSQKEDFIKSWKDKDRVPFSALDSKQEELPIVIFLPKDLAIESIEEKIRSHESELKEQKLEAIKVMQRLIEEWT